jgi:hypothetical protein
MIGVSYSAMAPRTPPPRRSPGRPRLNDADTSVSVTVRLPAKQLDALYDTARRERASLSSVIRRRLQAR